MRSRVSATALTLPPAAKRRSLRAAVSVSRAGASTSVPTLSEVIAFAKARAKAKDGAEADESAEVEAGAEQ